MDATRNDGADLGLLVLGLGEFGSRRASAAKRARGIRLIAVGDADDATAHRRADRLGVPTFGSLAEGLEMPGVDAVAVATPHADHDDAIRQAIDAGKSVLCEKPLSIDPDDARDLAQRADRAGVRLAVGFNHRFYPPVYDALKLVSEWSIGRVESVRATIGHRATAAFLAGWHADRAVSGGGTLMDNGPHACDLVRRFLGEVVAAEGYVRDTLGLPWGVESEAFALFRNHDRAVAEVRSSWTLESGYLTLEIRGSGGHLKVETAPWRLSGRLVDGTRVDRRYLAERVFEKVHQRRFGCETSLVSELEWFAHSDADGPSPAGTGWDGCRATEMIDAVYRSAASGSEVPLSPPIVRTPNARRAATRAATSR